MAGPFHRTYAYVDGGFLRASLDSFGANWDRLDVHTVSLKATQLVARWQGMECGLSRVFLYDAFDERESEKPATADSKVAAWLDGNDRQADTHVQRGRIAGARRREQKGVDVQLAVDALSAAHSQTYDVAILIAGDGDFTPLAEAIRIQGPLLVVASFEGRLSQDLRRTADRVEFLPSDPAVYKGWQLP